MHSFNLVGHISEIAETRIKEVRDELKEGDQILVKVLALEGNKIKLSRKAAMLGGRMVHAFSEYKGYHVARFGRS